MKNVWKIVGVLLVLLIVGVLLYCILNSKKETADVYVEEIEKDITFEVLETEEGNECQEDEIIDEDIDSEKGTKIENDIETDSLIDNVTGNGNGEEQQELNYASNNDYSVSLIEPDTDGDGIADDVEEFWGLNLEKQDSDDDGLTDYEEIYLTWTDPLRIDTDSDGISDGESDLDCDEIDNQTEIMLNISPISADTDGDNLTDYEEIYVYNTNPLIADTDADGVNDYDEVSAWINPLEKDSDYDGILDCDERIIKVEQKAFDDDEGNCVTEVRVDIEGTYGELAKVNILDISGTDIMSNNVQGLVGVPIEINTTGTFDNASIYFYYDENRLGDVKEEDLALLWYDEENNWYQILDDMCVVDTKNNRVIYKTTHFSTYMLVNSKVWTDTWRKDIVYRNGTEKDENPYLDIVFCIDCSGSMRGDRIKTAKAAIKNYVGSMQSEDEAAVVQFADSAYLECDFTNDTKTLENCIDMLITDGGTNVNYALRYGITLHMFRENGKRKLIILICDGDVNCEQSTIDFCNKYNVQVYAVNVENELTHRELENIAEQTGGQYYYSANLKEMETVFSEIQDDTLNEFDTTDTDGDGLYDIYETIGMILPNGNKIITDPTMADTDGDGLSDFQETGILLEVEDCYIGDGITETRRLFYMKSDPTKADTDGDEIFDREDKYAWHNEKEIVARLSNKYPDVEYLNIEEASNAYKVAGNQNWWKDMANSQAAKNYWDFATDKNYRLWKMGCGVIAVADVEIYLTQQNTGYTTSLGDIAYDESTGIIQKEDYISYINLASDLKYGFGGGILYYNTGLMPRDMELGLHSFLQMNNHEQTTVTWAPYSAYGKEDEELLVLSEIESMLKNNLPVVFAYYTTDKENPIVLYKEKEDAKNECIGSEENEYPTSHYMTIIGLYKYLDKSTMTFEYILEVVSWGDIYYIRYDEYSENINYFSNILRIQ